MKKIINNFIIVLILPVILLVFSACSFEFDPSGIIPEICINTNSRMCYIEKDDVYNLSVTKDEVYEIRADLGEYDEGDYYLEFALENEVANITLEGKTITTSSGAELGVKFKIFVNLRKTGSEKIYSTEEIIVEVVESV